ncbi:hypothetical protein MJO28_007254 [Puccinia striiformis f. sp. tritici]|uniref:Uncharacterized protein n=1 Tax=Puccinia striiformis f. sp. tritici TaxID=168172 RepID=A0ACC0EDX2_9BASI|nr:hypothetical protein MJO28_007254 [Puccinia striiformis f. sp. tritici]
MQVSQGQQMVRVILLAVFCSRATQCMDTSPLLGKSGAEDWGKGPDPSGSFEYVVKRPQGKWLEGDEVMEKPSFSQEDIQQYFKSIRQINKPSPGLSAKPQSSLDEVPVNPYWTTLRMNSMAEDVEKLTGDLDRLAKAIVYRKFTDGNDVSSLRKTFETIDNTILAENVRDLQVVHHCFKEYMEWQLKSWASTIGVPMEKLIADKKLSWKKKRSPGEEEALEIGPGTIATLFPTDRLEKVSVELCSRLNQIVKAPGYASAAARNLFLDFTHSEKDYKNPLFRNSDILLELSYSSPFVNMLNVIDHQEKARFLHQIIKLDALEYVNNVHSGFAESSLVTSFKKLFATDYLLKSLQETQLWNVRTGQWAQKYLETIIKIFMDDRIWYKNSGNNEGIRIMGQILKFVDKNFLQSESEFPTIVSIRGIYEDRLRNRIELLSARARAIVELEKISIYLNKGFPLQDHRRFEKPIPTLEELALIRNHIETLPSQKSYQKIIEIQDDRQKAKCKKEINDHINGLRDEISKFTKQHSGYGLPWLFSLFE